jgi:polyprenyl-phospho-N-acetylgalactosaminyl synthase
VPLQTAAVDQTLAALYVVVPAYREAEVIGQTVATLRAHVRHVVVVDDCSPDDTCAQARAAGAVVLRHPINLGQGAALQTGIAYALQCGAQYIATFDADGQHSPEDLYAMLARLIEGDLDIVIGSRFLGNAEDMPRSRALFLRLAVVFTKLTSGLPLTDTHNGLRVMTAQTARRIDITQNRMAHASEILEAIAKLKLKYEEAPVNIRYSAYSLQKGQRLSGSFDILKDLLVGWLRR